MSYKIERWDVILNSEGERIPIIYVKPDLEFIEFIKKNNYKIISEINGTDKKYNGNKMISFVDQSAYIPNCRPNFYDKTDLFVITLGSSWLGYPSHDKLGTVKFFSIKY